MLNINTNYAAAFAANATKKTSSGLDTAVERLSSGSRINYARDDAAGLAIATRLQAEVQSISVAARNAADAQSMIDTAEGALQETHNVLLRMRELAVQASSGTYSATDRDALNVEFEALTAAVEDIADDTQWNGVSLLNGASAFSFHVGANASQTISLTIADFETEESSMTSGVFEALADATTNNDNSGDDLDGLDVDTVSNAGTAITYIDTAISRVNAHRATLGATINRLEYAADNLANVSQNTSASRSRVLDADYAAETTELARTQIIQQAATAMLSQANQQAQSVLALLN